jgi:hypothetical protein
MKRVLLLMCVCALGLTSCGKKGAQPEAVATDGGGSTPAASSAVEEVGEGLSEEEATALLRDEKVQAGTQIGKEDIESELLRMEEEISADIEGREPDFEKLGSHKELKPLVARETFTVEKASSTMEYERDMRVMQMIREYIKQKKTEETKLTGTEKGADSEKK